MAYINPILALAASNRALNAPGARKNPLDAQGRPVYGSTGYDKGDETQRGVWVNGQLREQVTPEELQKYGLTGVSTYDPTYGYTVPSGAIGALDTTKAPGGNLALAAILALGAGAAGGFLPGSEGGALGGLGSEGLTIGNAPGILGEGASIMPVGAAAAEGGALTAAEQAAIAGAFPTTSGIGTTGLLGMTPAELAAVQGAFPLTTGAGAAVGAGAGAGILNNLPNVPTSGLGGGGGGSGGQQAIDASQQTIYDQAAQAGLPGYNPALASTAAGTAAGTGNWLSDLTGLPPGALQALGQLGATGLGVLGANAQQDALGGVADKYLALGAPYRGLLEQSYQPGFSIWNDQATRDAAGQAADIAARAYSGKYGNPFDSTTAQAGIYDNVLKGVALPQVNTYRSQLGSFGQLGTNIAGTADLSGAGSSGDFYNALGFGLGALTQPQNSLEDLLKKIGSNPFSGYTFKV